jgi:hypothetical protein
MHRQPDLDGDFNPSLVSDASKCVSTFLRPGQFLKFKQTSIYCARNFTESSFSCPNLVFNEKERKNKMQGLMATESTINYFSCEDIKHQGVRICASLESSAELACTEPKIAFKYDWGF